MSKNSEGSKIHSHLTKDINRIRKTAENQIRMNILRKHQIKLLNELIKKLIKEKRIDKKELKPYMPKKKQAEKELFENGGKTKTKKYQELLKLAREAIESKFYDKEVDVGEEIKRKYSKKQACFVTLKEDNMLRGCIGSLYPNQELWKDVIQNSIHAAFNDYRFHPVNENELEKIKIEISILSVPKKLGKGGEVFDKIDNKMGIILNKENCSSTFLPQVWEQIPDKKEFLEQLSMKAGLDKESWRDAEIWFYEVERVKER